MWPQFHRDCVPSWGTSLGLTLQNALPSLSSSLGPASQPPPEAADCSSPEVSLVSGLRTEPGEVRGLTEAQVARRGCASSGRVLRVCMGTKAGTQLEQETAGHVSEEPAAQRLNGAGSEVRLPGPAPSSASSKGVTSGRHVPSPSLSFSVYNTGLTS